LGRGLPKTQAIFMDLIPPVNEFHYTIKYVKEQMHPLGISR